MSSGVPSVLILGHSFVKRLKRDLRSHFDGNFKLGGTASVHLHGVGGRTVAKLRSSDLHVVERIAPDVVILEIETNDLVDISPEVVGSEIENLVRLLLGHYKVRIVCVSFHVVIPTTMRHLLRGALRFSSIISTLCFLSSQMSFVGYIELFLTRGKIFICLMASTLTQRVSTIYIVVTGMPFFGHYACFKIIYHIPCICEFFHLPRPIFMWFVTFSPVSCCWYIHRRCVKIFILYFWGIRPLHYGLWLVHLFCYFVWWFVLNFMDSSIVLFVVVLLQFVIYS